MVAGASPIRSWSFGDPQPACIFIDLGTTCCGHRFHCRDIQRSKESRTARIETLFLILETLPISEAIGKKFGHYPQKYSKSHSLEPGDALIAAAVCVADLFLWTINKNHYPMPDVRLFSALMQGARLIFEQGAAEERLAAEGCVEGVQCHRKQQRQSCKPDA